MSASHRQANSFVVIFPGVWWCAISSLIVAIFLSSTPNPFRILPATGGPSFSWWRPALLLYFSSAGLIPTSWRSEAIVTTSRFPPWSAWIRRAWVVTSRACAMRRASSPKNRSISLRTLSYILPPSRRFPRRPLSPGSPPPPKGDDDQDGENQAQDKVGHEVEGLQVGRSFSDGPRQEIADGRHGGYLLLPVGGQLQGVGQVEPREVPADMTPTLP